MSMRVKYFSLFSCFLLEIKPILWRQINELGMPPLAAFLQMVINSNSDTIKPEQKNSAGGHINGESWHWKNGNYNRQLFYATKKRWCILIDIVAFASRRLVWWFSLCTRKAKSPMGILLGHTTVIFVIWTFYYNSLYKPHLCWYIKKNTILPIGTHLFFFLGLKDK